jgi:AraC family transcriptional regulator of arabinose operon
MSDMHDLRIQRAIDLITSKFDKPLNLYGIAQSVHLSKSRFVHLFRQEIGTSAGKFLRGVRMRAAQHLLETSALSIKEVFCQTGFGDESHFVRDFKARYGITPSEYRARYTGKSGKSFLSRFTNNSHKRQQNVLEND